MKLRLLTQIPGMTLAVMLTLVVAHGLVSGHADDHREAAKHTKKENYALRGPYRRLKRVKSMMLLSFRAARSGRPLYLGRFISCPL